MIDISPVVPEAQQTVLQAAEVFAQHIRPWLVGLLIHGSALKGGFIPGCSDIDMQLYLSDAILEKDGSLPLSLALAIHRDLAKIDPAPFQYIQCYKLSGKYTSEERKVWIGPIPGAYHILTGHLPVPEATEQQVLQRALHTLEHVHTIPGRVSGNLLEHGGGKLPRAIRFLCTDVWPVLYSILTCRADHPFEPWRLPKDAAIARLPENEPGGKEIRQFYKSLRAYYAGEHEVDAALAVIEQGVRFLRAVQDSTKGFQKHLGKHNSSFQEL